MSFIVDFGWLAIVVVILAFLCEYMDASLGMGYGTTLTPVLLFFVEDIAMIVPAVLLSEFIAGIVSATFHIIFKNVNIGQKEEVKNASMNELNSNIIETRTASGTTSPSNNNIRNNETGNGFTRSISNLTRDTKVVLILAFFGVLGAICSSVITAVFHTNEAFNFGAKIYIGLMVMAMGIVILVLRNKEQKFSYRKIVSLGVLAGFNKGLSGGGYGPITVSGQILAGREGKTAIASTSISEATVCFVGVTAYIITNIIMMNRGDLEITWDYLGFAPYLIIGAIFSAPLAALTTKKVEAKWLKVAVGWATIVLGIFSIIRYSLHYTGIW